ncbi:hypothetical protein NL676_008092 [Syzygium grande]|nr:hypothetical protein NL676_008092 [Syzygium grande]
MASENILGDVVLAGPTLEKLRLLFFSFPCVGCFLSLLNFLASPSKPHFLVALLALDSRHRHGRAMQRRYGERGRERREEIVDFGADRGKGNDLLPDRRPPCLSESKAESASA